LEEGTGCEPCTSHDRQRARAEFGPQYHRPPITPPIRSPNHRPLPLPGLKGTFTNAPGQLECSVCEPGRVAVTKGSTNCSLCPSGTHLPAPTDEVEDEAMNHDEKSDCRDCKSSKPDFEDGAGGKRRGSVLSERCGADPRIPVPTLTIPHHLHPRQARLDRYPLVMSASSVRRVIPAVSRHLTVLHARHAYSDISQNRACLARNVREENGRAGGGGGSGRNACRSPRAWIPVSRTLKLTP